MKIKINIKKLAPTISLCSATAAATPIIVMQCQESKHSIVINNFAGNKPVSLTKLHKNVNIKAVGKIKVNGLPELKLNSQQSLGSAWSQYLLQSDKHDAWVDNEKELLRSSTNNPSSLLSIKSEIFKAAKAAIEKNKKVNGQVIHEVCKKAYKISKISRTDENLIKDVWNYCNIKSKDVKRAR